MLECPRAREGCQRELIHSLVVRLCSCNRGRRLRRRGIGGITVMTFLHLDLLPGMQIRDVARVAKHVKDSFLSWCGWKSVPSPFWACADLPHSVNYATQLSIIP